MARDTESKKYTVALAGNPNVGKSTVFNCLTGMHQHTGNWAGKTVENAKGDYTYNGSGYSLYDLPGTYSLFSRSAEEECAEDFISFNRCDAVVIVADASCLERNLILVYQVLKLTSKAVLAVNMMDEAEKKGIKIDFKALKEALKIPVVPLSAGRKRGLAELKRAVEAVCRQPEATAEAVFCNGAGQKSIHILNQHLKKLMPDNSKTAYLAMRILTDKSYLERTADKLKIKADSRLFELISQLDGEIAGEYGSQDGFNDAVADFTEAEAKSLYLTAVNIEESRAFAFTAFADKIFTGRYTGPLTMLLMLFFILWLTVSGANYPSELLSGFLLGAEDKIAGLFLKIGVSEWLTDMLVHGGYRVTAWVVSVMLPPMAIFFPLFTLLEDFGYLPRVAFNLDYYLKKANTCGKQALTMCMGFGCNAVGVTGCRIIDSPRERLIATLTNSFVPCNGRFPTLIAIITVFFTAGLTGVGGSLASSAALFAVIVLGVCVTLAVSRLLSKTLLKGVPSAFVLEMPPLRRPQICKTLVRSIFDRTLFVLGRAVSVALPAGVIIWIFANVRIGNHSVLELVTDFLEPLGKLMGMDGVILTAFILGFPANEIVIPVMLMAYLKSGELCSYESLAGLGEILSLNGWSIKTAICVSLFCLMHWPCSTTLLTVKKETGSLKWTVLAAAIPTAVGALCCIAVNLIFNFLGI